MIIECPKCHQKNRIVKHNNKKLCPICGRCKTPLISEIIGSNTDKQKIDYFINFVLIVLITIVCFLIINIPNILAKDFSLIISEEEAKIEKLKKEEEQKLLEFKTMQSKELAQIDPQALRLEAIKNYENIFDARKNYDQKYALTPREKGQLKMLEISSSASKRYRDIILEIAKEASPYGSHVRTENNGEGVSLHIDFDMSSMTSGETGTRTKHNSISSLKKEVISLISRVSNDVFEFCSGLDIQKIYIGCKHHVNVTYPDGSTQIENTILYKIQINRDDISSLETNPFLEQYSTTEHFIVVVDDFENIEITSEYSNEF